MKQTTILTAVAAIVAMLFALQIQAQNFTERGNFLVGTAIGFSSNTSNKFFSIYSKTK